MAACRSFQIPADAGKRGNILMRRGRISAEGNAEEIAVSTGPRYRQTRHGQKSNPYSNKGLDKLESVHAELSARRKYIAMETGAPEAMVRFMYSSKDGWIPVVPQARDQGTGKKNSAGDAPGVSILGSAESNNGKASGELRRKNEGNEINGDSERKSFTVSAHASPVRAHADPTDFCATVLSAESNNGKASGELRRKNEGNEINGDSERKGFTVSAHTSPVRAHADPTDFCATASPRTVNPKNIDPDNKQQQQHHHSDDKKLRRVVSMGNWSSTRPVSPVQGSDIFFRNTRPGVAYDANVCALTVMIVTLICFIFYGRLCAILFTSSWLYLVSMFREGSERMRGMNRNNNNGRMVNLRSSENREMVGYGWNGEEEV